MSDNIIQLNEAAIKGELKDLVKNSVEETLNALLDHEADELINAERYERSGDRKGYRSGHYDRNFTTTSGDVTLHVPKLKGIQFETAIIERYRRRETSIEEALIECISLASQFVVLKILPRLYGEPEYPPALSVTLIKRLMRNINKWRCRPLTGDYAYVYVDGVYLKRSWGWRNTERICACCHRCQSGWLSRGPRGYRRHERGSRKLVKLLQMAQGARIIRCTSFYR